MRNQQSAHKIYCQLMCVLLMLLSGGCGAGHKSSPTATLTSTLTLTPTVTKMATATLTSTPTPQPVAGMWQGVIVCEGEADEGGEIYFEIDNDGNIIEDISILALPPLTGGPISSIYAPTFNVEVEGSLESNFKTTGSFMTPEYADGTIIVYTTVNLVETDQDITAVFTFTNENLIECTWSAKRTASGD